MVEPIETSIFSALELASPTSANLPSSVISFLFYQGSIKLLEAIIFNLVLTGQSSPSVYKIRLDPESRRWEPIFRFTFSFVIITD